MAYKFLALFWYVCILRLAISTRVYFAKNVAYFPFNSRLSFQRLCRFYGDNISSDVLQCINGCQYVNNTIETKGVHFCGPVLRSTVYEKYMYTTCPQMRSPMPKRMHQSHWSIVNAAVEKNTLPNWTINTCTVYISTAFDYYVVRNNSA